MRMGTVCGENPPPQKKGLAAVCCEANHPFLQFQDDPMPHKSGFPSTGATLLQNLSLSNDIRQ
jgi:hypothetical protein